MGHAVFDHLAGIGVVDDVVIQCGGSPWSEDVRAYL